MKGLLLDTSTERAFVALMKEKTLLFLEELPFGLNHSRNLMQVIDRAFDTAHETVSKLDYIGVGVGPGSYTGVRVGATVSKTLSYVHHIPLVGISSLYGFIPQIDTPFAAVIDARIGGVYLCVGEKRGDRITYTKDPCLSDLKELPNLLQDITYFVTPNAGWLKEKFPTRVTWEEKGIDPTQFGSLVKEKLKNGQYTTNGELELLYLRKSQAEMEKEDRTS